jgi:hypothetical protein
MLRKEAVPDGRKLLSNNRVVETQFNKTKVHFLQLHRTKRDPQKENKS